MDLPTDTLRFRKTQAESNASVGSAIAVTRKPKERNPWVLVSVATAVSMVTSLIYLTYRLGSTIWEGEGNFVIWIVLLVELLTTEHSVLVPKSPEVPRLFTQLAVCSASSQAGGERFVHEVEDSGWPPVDVLVPYCGEGEDIVLNTAKAACACDYPTELLRVIILDDSRSCELAQSVEGMKSSWPNLAYASRNIEVKTHSKASNLNFGLRHLENLEASRAPYIAVLDMDMIPEPQWLRRVVPHVLHNPRAGLACPFQRFYNIPEGDPLGMNMDLQPIECVVCIQDSSDNSWCTGSGFVVRSSALKTIGGFPEESMQEDVLISTYLAASGWITIFVPDPVQWGLVPDTMPGYLKQSQRWAISIMSVAHFARSYKAKQLPKEARLNLILWAVVTGSASFIWTFALVALPWCVMTGKALITPFRSVERLRVLLRLATLDFGAQTIYQILMSSVLDYRMPIHGRFTALWTQPYRALIVLRYFVLPKLFGSELPKFSPSGIPTDGESERVARAKRSHLTCYTVIFWDCGAWIFLIILLASAVGAFVWLRPSLEGYVADEDARKIALKYLTGLAWPPVLFLWGSLTKAAWLPVSYAFRPPPLTERSILLTHDEDRDVDYPSEKVKTAFMRSASQLQLHFKCLVAFSALIVGEML
ncbi:hypothetical protein ACLMJK_009265 [Lecanora helva]